jgi:hypothetical protein
MSATVASLSFAACPKSLSVVTDTKYTHVVFVSDQPSDLSVVLKYAQLHLSGYGRSVFSLSVDDGPQFKCFPGWAWPPHHKRKANYWVWRVPPTAWPMGQTGSHLTCSYVSAPGNVRILVARYSRQYNISLSLWNVTLCVPEKQKRKMQTCGSGTSTSTSGVLQVWPWSNLMIERWRARSGGVTSHYYVPLLSAESLCACCE